MIEWFNCSLKSALRSRLAGFLHLLLVLLGLRTVPKDDTGLSVSEAIYGSPLTVPGEFLGSPEFPPSTYLRKIEQAVAALPLLRLIMFPSLRLVSSHLPCCQQMFGFDIEIFSFSDFSRGTCPQLSSGGPRPPEF